MEIFVCVKKALAILGIIEIRNRKCAGFIQNLSISTTIIVQLFATLTTGWHLVFCARTFEKRAQAATLVMSLVYAQTACSMVWAKRVTLMSYLSEMQRMAGKRKNSLKINVTAD